MLKPGPSRWPGMPVVVRRRMSGSRYAVISTSRHPDAELPAGADHGDRNAGRYSTVVLTRRVDTVESAFTTPGGRPPGCLYTTTCDVATGGARLMHRKHESAVVDRPHYQWTSCRDTPSQLSALGRRSISTIFWLSPTETFESRHRT